MNRYTELRKRQQEEFNAMPIGAAYGKTQFAEMMKKWDLCHGDDGEPTEDDCKQVVHVFAGVYIRKNDAPALEELLARQRKEFDDAVAADDTGDGFIYDMFYAELCSHEYSYTGDEWETLDALGLCEEDFEKNPCLLHGLEKAERDIMHLEGENNG